MKRLLVPVFAGCIGVAAHAQSMVTLYGLIDNGVSYVNDQRTASGTGKEQLLRFHGKYSWRPIWCDWKRGPWRRTAGVVQA